MKFSRVPLGGVLLQAALLAAWAPWARALPTAAAPTTRPSDLSALVRQLGDDDFHLRVEAADKLKASGKAALPALEEARKSPDPEIHARAEDLIGQIEHPFVDLGRVPQPTGYGQQAMSAQLQPDKYVLDCREPGRTTHIEVTPAGVHMTVTGYLDGKEVTREYKAHSIEHLKTMNAEAFALYQKLAGQQFGFLPRGNVMIQGNIRVQINGGGGAQFQIQRGGQPALIPPMQIKPPIDPLDRLQLKIHEQIRLKSLPEPQQAEIDKLLKQLQEKSREMHQGGVVVKDPDAIIREFNERCDALRKRLAELNLDDPGDALPPPAGGKKPAGALQENGAK